MASPAGSPNTSGNYEAQAVFKPPNAGPSPGSNPRPPFHLPSAYPAPPLLYPTPPLPGAFSYPPATPPFHHHPFLHYPQEPLHRPPAIYSPAAASPQLTNPNPTPNPSPSPNSNPGARLMALLNPPAHLESAVSMPLPSSSPSDFLSPSGTATAILHPVPSAPPAALVQPTPVRMPSNKLPRGRLLGSGERVVYDVDSRLPGESQPPQLEVTPITKYISDPGLVLGRQIAVNRNYICYGLKLGAIRVLNINTALRSLLKGHSQVKIWDDRKVAPLAVFKPHDGHPVNSVAFMTSPHCPDHINLITAGPLSREVKIWASAGEEGWVLPTDSESWRCTQTLDLRSSLESHTEEAFFNQIVVLPQASLIVIANAKKNAIYAVHVDYGPYPSSTRMDYIADFTVAMPILSLTGTHDCLPDGEQLVQVYCVQTQAIQQYALDLLQCLPPPTTSAGLERDHLSRVVEIRGMEGLAVPEPSCGLSVNDFSTENISPKSHLTDSSINGAPAASHAVTEVSTVGTSTLELSESSFEVQPSAPPAPCADVDALHVTPVSVPFNMDFAGTLPDLKSPEKSEDAPSNGGCEIDQSISECSVDRRVDSFIDSALDVPMTEGSTLKDESKAGQNGHSMLSNPRLMFKLGGNLTHLVTPSEILSGAISSSESSHANKRSIKEVKAQDMTTCDDIESAEVEVKVVAEDKPGLQEFDSQKVPEDFGAEDKEISLQTSIADFSMENECSTIKGTPEETRPGEDNAISQSKKHLPSTFEAKIRDDVKNTTEEVTGSAVMAASQSPLAANGKKQIEKSSPRFSPSSPSSSPFNYTESFNEPGSSTGVPPADAAFSEIPALQETVNQVKVLFCYKMFFLI
ncbi:hypothetical protein BHE74_00027345 [Ensete ventricosum]|nr:hypothetical protein BHE74_00027345 [Ensete ventricosum]RZS05029.1 hypothetical protein BHM03_00035474 [Ensete ventricosum]